MFTTRITLSVPVPVGHRDELERRIFFVSSDIVDFELVADDEWIREVVLTSRVEPAAEEMAAKLDFVVANDLLTQRPVPPKVIWRSRERRRVPDDVFDQLRAAGLAGELGEGQVYLGGSLLALMDHFDRALTDLLRAHFDVREYRYPTLIPSKSLDTSGYISSFPQNLMLVTRLHADVDVYRAFREEYAEHGGFHPSVLASCDNVDYCLPPTMCYHTFGQYAGRVVDDGAPHVVTARGKAFRFESRYSTTLERLWDFTIREIVFMGHKDDVVAARERFMRAVFAYVDELGLDGRAEVASDPFFCNTDTADRVWAQRLLELKYELRLAVAGGRTISVGSFNFHDDFFGTSFGITRADGMPISSGCVGFGLERLIYAFICQHGLDPAGWPGAIAAAVADISREAAST